MSNNLRIYDRGFQEVSVASIEYIEGQSNYSLIHFVNRKRPILVARCVGHLHELLPDFIRLDKSSLVNPQYVVSYFIRSGVPSFVHLSNSRKIPVSRRKATGVKRQLQQVWSLN